MPLMRGTRGPSALTKGFGVADSKDYYKIVLPNSAPDQMLTSFASPNDQAAVVQSDTWIANSPAYNGQELYLSHHMANGQSNVVKHYSGINKVTAPVIQTPVTTTPVTVQTQDATQDTNVQHIGVSNKFKAFMADQAIPNVPNYVPVSILVVGGVIAAVVVATRK